MRKFIWSITCCLALGGAQSLAADTHEHAHGKSHEAGLSLDHGKKWATDESLRKGMSEIRAAMAAKAPGNNLAAAGEKVSAQLSYIFKNCKLKPEADAMLHVLLARILGGAASMKENAKPAEQAKGAEAVREALLDYPRFFDHPGWKPL